VSIPREFIELLLAKIDIVDLISAHIPMRKKTGSNYFALCPFHQEKSGSFSVSQTKQFYYCFGCGAHGNAIDFLINQERLSFPEAIETLARQAGMSMPENTMQIKKDDHLPALYELMTSTATFYYEHLRQAKRAIEYLKGRGISGQTAKLFQIGFAPAGWQNLIDELGKNDIEKKKLLETGLIIKKDEGGYYDRFRDRIMFPIIDYRGRIVGFGGRIIDQGEPKYLNSPETTLFQKGHELYGLYQASKANHHLDKVLVVEGYMDVIALFQHGITYAVATLGTATTAHHIHRLTRYTNEIVFCFDGDEAGRTAANRALHVLMPLMQDDLQIRFLFLPDGEDPDTLVRKEGKTGFDKRLSSAISLSAYFFQSLAKQCDLSTIEGRARYAASALTYIKQVPAGMLTEILLEELAKRVRMDLSELKGQLKSSQLSTPEKLSPLINATETPKPKLKPPMQMLLALLVQEPSLVKHITEPLPESTLTGMAFLKHLIEVIRTNENMTTAQLIEHYRSQREERFVANLAIWEHTIPEAGITQEWLGALKQLRNLSLEEEINRLLAKASQDGLSDDEKQTLSLCISQKKSVVLE